MSLFEIGIFIGALCLAPTAQAQLSPGKLSRAHAGLEGLRHCNQCHELGNREVLGKCLACHEEIQEMRTTGQGLHADESHADCVDCHVEHQGRDVALIYWDQGQSGFDHVETGYELQGRHSELACRMCHTQKHIQDPGRWRARGKNLEQTFLGLGRECLDCHQDHHQGQLGTDCLGCHDQRNWRQQPRFDHDRTAFVLDGQHHKTECVKCHPLRRISTDAEPVPNYKSVDHTTCAACHQDPHQGALGPSCADCHNTGGWLKLAKGKFNHDLTRYPLKGRHAGLDCDKCHGAGVRVAGSKRPAFAACVDCHRDQHGALKRSKPSWNQCESCHDVTGFIPANFTLARHQETNYPLSGSHLAVPCGACHRRDLPGQASVLDLAPKGTDCRECHRSPHGPDGMSNGGVPGTMACSKCHNETSWRAAAMATGYDHAQTGFPLTGRHLVATCRGCHQPVQDKPGTLVFPGAPRNCAGCHADPHAGQFSESHPLATSAVDCGHCHVTTDWLAEKFDHATDTRFLLQGSHENTPCQSCHQTEKTAQGMMIRYRPLTRDCVGCHAAGTRDRKVKS